MGELVPLGVEVEPARWWDETQKGDILHYMNRPPIQNVRLAKQKGYKVVMTETCDQTASRSRGKLFAQRWVTKLTRAVVPHGLTVRLAWDVYQELDAMVYLVPHEWETVQYLFGADPQRGHVIPHGLEVEVIAELGRPQPEEDYLISTATIHPRKNTVLLARAARLAKIPILFLGRPYAPDDPYFLEFKSCVDDHIVRYPGFVSVPEKYRYLRGARGFVLLSQYESGSVAVYEAAAAGLPLLLSNLPWATRAYREARDAKYVSARSAESLAGALATFYDQAHRKPGTTFPILSGRQVAAKYLEIYQTVLGRA